MKYFEVFSLRLQSLSARVDLLEVPLSALKDSASQLEQIIPEASRPVTSHSVSSLWHRWTRLHAVSRAQERALEDTVRDWRSFTEKVGRPQRIYMPVNGSASNYAEVTVPQPAGAVLAPFHSQLLQYA